MATDPGAARVAMADLETVRRRRAELRGSASALEHALAAPTPGRSAAWSERVRAALMELLADFREHVDFTEAADGLYAGVRKSAPRLSSKVARLVEEHAVLVTTIADLLEHLDHDMSEQGHADIDELRGRGTALLGELVRHRQRGSDLVYEAYQVDIGGQD